MKDMESVNTVRTSTIMVSRWVRQWSRITSTKPLLTMLALLMVCLFGVNENAWGQWNSTLTAIANPAEGGGVYATKEKKTSLADSDYKSPSDESGKIYCAAFWSTATFYAYYHVNTGYKFVNWSTGATTWEIAVTANKDNKHPSVTANFAPIDYTIRFKGNGSNGGSTANLEMKYATAQNLTKNGFTREYTVTYDENGGSTVTDATAAYSFIGWATSANGNKVYNDKQSVNNLTTTDGDYVDLYAKWTSASVTLPSATKEGAVLDGWYNGNTKVGEAGASYTPTANVTLKAKWIDKYTPSMTGANQSMMVDGVQETAFSFGHVSGPVAHISVTSISSVNNGNGKVIEYDAVNNKIIAHNAGVATIYFTQDETETIKKGTSETYTYTVYKYNSTFASVEDKGVKVDADVTSSYTLTYTKPNNAYIGTASIAAGTPVLGESTSFYYTLTQNVTTDKTTGSPNASLAITYNAGTKTATGKNAGTGTIHLYQPETYKYNAADEDFVVTVTKNANTLYANNSATYKPTMRMGQDLAVTLTATNTDYVNSPIELVAQTSGDNTVAVFDYTQNTHSGTVHSKYNKDVTATWSIHQDENYKYLEGNGTFSVDVKLAATTCDYVLEEASEHHVSFYTNNGGLSYNLSAPGETLYIKIGKESWATTQTVYIYGYDANNNESTIASYDPGDLAADGEDKEIPISENIVKIKIQAGGTQYKWFSNLRVSRKVQLEASAITIDKTSTNNPVYPSDGTGVGVLPVTYLLAGGGDLHIYNDNPKFTVLQPTISNASCQSEAKTTNIGIQYNSAAAGTDYAHLVIYNDCYRKEVTITGITSKRNQTVEWNVGNAIRLGTETENAAAFNVGNPVSYSSSNPAIIEIKDNKLVAKAEGSAVITATSPGNGEYKDGVAEKTIEVTNDLIQTIVWNQSFLKLKLGGANITLNASAHSDVAGCTTNGARPITYSSNNESVVRIVNTNQLQIMGTGSAVITATQAGGLDGEGHKYMRVTEDRTVIVRDPNAPCDNYVYIQPSEHEAYLGWNHLNRQSDEFVIDNLDEPSTLTLRYKGEYKTVWGVDYFYGTMRVEEWYDDDWHLVPDGDLGTPQIGNYQTLNTTLQRRTTKVRIRSIEGCGYHYFTDCKIGQSRYIEATELSDYEAKVGQSVPQTTTISYNNIVGDVSITLGHTPSNFSVSQETISGDCGDKGSVVLTVTYQPTSEVVEEQELLTISDETSTCQITLRGSASLTSRYISWDETPVAKYTVETVTLDAQALTTVGQTSAGEVFYSLGELSSTGVLSGTNNSTLTFENAGVAYVIAQGKDDPRYNIPVAVTKQFNVSKTPTSISVAPTVETIVSGTAAEDVVLNTASAVSGYDVNGFSGTVPGTWSVIEEDLNTVGENRSIKIHFEPSNTDMFIGCDGYINNVTVSQREATEEEVIGVASAITYGQTAAEASTLSNDGTLAGTWEWIDERADDVLAVYTYTDMQARFTPENGNIQPKVVNVSLTVNKANPVATANAVEITYGATAASVDLEGTGLAGAWSWKDSRKDDVLAVGEYTMDVHFKPTDLTNYNEKDATVALKVKKITTLEVYVPLSFCAGGSETFHGKTYTTAGTDQIEATGATRDTVYNVIVTVLQPTTGTDTKTIVCGASESWNGIDLSGYTVGSHSVEAVLTNAVGCDSTVTLSLTVNAAVNTFIGTGEWENPNNWSEHVVPNGDAPTVIVSGALSIDENVTVGNLTIEQTGSVSVISGGTLTVKGVSETRAEYGDVHVLNDGALALINSANLQVRDFTLDASLGNSSNPATSGQVNGDVNLHINRDAYFQMSFDPAGAITYGWYDFTVPFEVNINGGIKRVTNNGLEPMVCGQDFLLMEDDEANYVNGGKGWRQISNGALEPGKLYTITFDDDVNQNTFRFTWNQQGLLRNGDVFAAQYLTSDDVSRNGWNALGNAMLRHGYVNGTYKIQAFNHTDNTYEIVDKPKTFAVGTAFFIQVQEAGDISWTAAEAATERPLFAPQREANDVEEFRLCLHNEVTDAVNDVLFFSASEEAKDTYMIGHDLLKRGTPTEAKKAQMWATKDGKTLCDVETVLLNYKASSPLSFFTPKAQTYTLMVDKAPENATLYLTYNNRAIWNLSMSPYELDLTNGTTEGYGLRIVASQQTTTDIENGGLLNDANGVRKVLIDNVIYIVTPEGKMYDIVGKSVKY